MTAYPFKAFARPLLFSLVALLTACGGATESTTADSPRERAASPDQPYGTETIVETGYITMTDGTRLRYHMERLVEAPPGPVVMQYDGYDAGTGFYFSDVPDVKAALLAKGYSILGVSARGTGCSSGEFDLFEPQRAVDGAEAVEWAAEQPWSDGNIGMLGYSYPGIMQLLVAAQQPPHLKAIAPANIVFDLYRDVGSPGGIPNGAFAALFTGQQQAPGAGSLLDALEQEDPECFANYTANRAEYQSFLAEALSSPHIDGPFDWLARSAMSTAERIGVPVLNINYWQDEQTGSRIGGAIEAGGLLETLGLGTTWTVMSNGNHDMTWGHPEFAPLQVQFFERYLRGIDNGWENTPRIQIQHEVGTEDVLPSWTTSYAELPSPEATSLHLRANGILATEPEGTAELSESFVYPLPSSSTNPLPGVANPLHEIWRLPAADEGRLVWTTPALASDLQLLGSASVDVWLSSTADDTDLQATITEVRPDGQEVYVARGWLRASKRALDESRSTPTRPFHLHDEASVQLLTPNEPTFMRVEVFPFAHRFRAGSALRLIIDSPVGITGDWGGYILPTPAINTVHLGTDHPSRIVVGVMRDDAERPAARACGELANQPCRESVAPVPQGRLQVR